MLDTVHSKEQERQNDREHLKQCKEIDLINLEHATSKQSCELQVVYGKIQKTIHGKQIRIPAHFLYFIICGSSRSPSHSAWGPQLKCVL